METEEFIIKNNGGERRYQTPEALVEDGTQVYPPALDAIFGPGAGERYCQAKGISFAIQPDSSSMEAWKAQMAEIIQQAK